MTDDMMNLLSSGGEYSSIMGIENSLAGIPA
jgi:hypothetical protein